LLECQRGGGRGEKGREGKEKGSEGEREKKNENMNDKALVSAGSFAFMF
jgi:hypothetical protein